MTEAQERGNFDRMNRIDMMIRKMVGRDDGETKVEVKRKVRKFRQDEQD